MKKPNGRHAPKPSHPMAVGNPMTAGCVREQEATNPRAPGRALRAIRAWVTFAGSRRDPWADWPPVWKQATRNEVFLCYRSPQIRHLVAREHAAGPSRDRNAESGNVVLRPSEIPRRQTIVRRGREMAHTTDSNEGVSQSTAESPAREGCAGGHYVDIKDVSYPTTK